tara:strand:- start:366 stop:599 length:234 start_codon:yes stop_codon:yes gene_type:complete
MKDEVERDNYVYPGKRFTKSGYGIGAGQGMSLRDYFAGQAMVGLAQDESLTTERTGELAYQLADAMLKTRKAPTDKE